MSNSALPPQAALSLTIPLRRFLDAKQVGELLHCSWRHVLRMADRGLLPWGVKLGALRRWDADELARIAHRAETERASRSI
jgi:hypothetical protein